MEKILTHNFFLAILVVFSTLIPMVMFVLNEMFFDELQ